VLLLDRSVEDPGADEGRGLWAKLQQHANELLAQVSRQADARMTVAVVAYGVDSAGQPDVRIGLPGALADRTVVRGDELSGNELRIEEVTEHVPNGIGGLVELTRKRPVFLELEPTVGDPAALAGGLGAAAAVTSEWQAQHPSAAVPPVVLHVTRGRWDPERLTEAVGPLETLAESGQGVLLYHLVATDLPHRSLAYPDQPAGIEDPGLAMLWQKSSPLLGAERLSAEKRFVTPASRGIVINGKFDLLLDAVAGVMPSP
jgi:hypothetical protein